MYWILHPLSICKAGLGTHALTPHNAVWFKSWVTKKSSFSFVHQSETHLREKIYKTQWNWKSVSPQDFRAFSASHYVTIKSLTEAAVLANSASGSWGVLKAAQSHMKRLCQLHLNFPHLQLVLVKEKWIREERWKSEQNWAAIYFLSMYRGLYCHQFLFRFLPIGGTKQMPYLQKSSSFFCRGKESLWGQL